MREYCKAYRLAELRRYPQWAEPPAERSGDAIVYLWDDLTVVADPVAADGEVLWADVTDDWARFCRTELAFAPPAGLDEGEA